ncbi:MAG TPA: hypothetical protein VFV11_06275 [Solimonas sp.]|nr:hypothetical protein [Solimonas sp.]
MSTDTWAMPLATTTATHREPAPGRGVLFLVSTPLHSLWALAIARGQFADRPVALARIDTRAGSVDYIAEAIRQVVPAPFVEVAEFAEIGKRPLQKLRRARQVMTQLQTFASQRRYGQVVVGNDRRAEFYGALAASPGAVGGYLDDGTASYAPPPPRRAPRLHALTQGISARVRQLVYGLPTEKPDALGTARAVREAWVLLPGEVGGELAGKRIHGIQPQWFADPLVRATCERAIELAGLDPAAVRRLRHLLVLPHDSFLRQDPGLRRRFEDFLRIAAESGQPCAIKRHPRSRELGLDGAGGDLIEIPRRLPLEIVAPLLSDAQVVGTLSSALIYLKALGARVEVSAFIPQSLTLHPVARLLRSLGIPSVQYQPTTPAPPEVSGWVPPG